MWERRFREKDERHGERNVESSPFVYTNSKDGTTSESWQKREERRSGRNQHPPSTPPAPSLYRTRTNSVSILARTLTLRNTNSIYCLLFFGTARPVCPSNSFPLFSSNNCVHRVSNVSAQSVPFPSIRPRVIVIKIVGIDLNRSALIRISLISRFSR